METSQLKSVLPEQSHNKFIKLLSELTGDELQIAIYLLTIQDRETWNDFRPMSTPTQPVGYDRAFAEYTSEKNPTEKSNLFREMTENTFKGYFKALVEAHGKNDSDIKFLQEMLDCFEKKTLTSYANIARSRINEYRQNY